MTSSLTFVLAVGRRLPAPAVIACLVPVLLILLPETAYAAAEGEAESPWATVARLLNFAILAGVLVYFLKSPLATYLVSRGTQIRKDLVTAAEMRASATAHLAEIEQKMKALPAELDSLKRQGAEDVKAEQARMTHAAAAERQRLIEQMRREIDMRLRVARRDLTAHAAELAVSVAEERIKRTITPDDQVRLVDRYTAQLRAGAPGGAGKDAAR
jgi:F-type H+-transporting ATPase subunit b